MTRPKKHFSKDGKTVLPERPYKRKRFTPPNLDSGFGIKVRSKPEIEAVKFFEENEIKYQYEPLLLLAGKQYRPDFFLPDLKLFVEICGYIHMPYYRDRVEHKKKIYEKSEMQVVFVSCDRKETVGEKLKELLCDYIQ